MHTRELFDLSGKTALVTGGGRGLGRDIATGLAEAGARVFVVSRTLDACEKVAAEIREGGGEATAHSADISKPEQIDALLAAIGPDTPVDVLVNNAGMVWAAPTLDYPLAGWDRVFDLNVRGLFYLSQQVARRMAARCSGGSIIQIASISAWRGAPDDEQPVIAYNASKGAVVAMTIDLAVKLAAHKIRVNAIAPGPFQTDMMNHIRHDAKRLERYEKTLPLGYSGRADDIKGVAVFLASEASRYMTGQTIAVDGGLTAVGPPQGPQ